MATEVVSEAEKMRRVPGIVFMDNGFGNVPVIAGTGLQVYEIVKAYREFDEDRAELAGAFHWLSPIQLQAALNYALAFPDEIDARIRQDYEMTPDKVWKEYPFTRPHYVSTSQSHMDTSPPDEPG